MSDRTRQNLARWQRRWTTIVDWLGAQKPLNLILGMVALISAGSVIAHLF